MEPPSVVAARICRGRQATRVSRGMDHRKFPSLGGVADPKGLTGWFVTLLHTLGTSTPALRATPPKEGNITTPSVPSVRIRCPAVWSGP